MYEDDHTEPVDCFFRLRMWSAATGASEMLQTVRKAVVLLGTGRAIPEELRERLIKRKTNKRNKEKEIKKSQ